MIYTVVAATLITLSYGAANVNTGDGSRCGNYFLEPSWPNNDLYPVGTCYYENSDADEVIQAGGSTAFYSTVQNMMYKCEVDTDNTYGNVSTGTAQKVCPYRMGVNCGAEIQQDGTCYPCNGIEDQCECTVGASQAAVEAECQYYEETNYQYTWGWNGVYCDHKENTKTRRVVNMCIQGGDSTAYTQEFACGGYDYDRSVADAAYMYNNGESKGTTSVDCADAPTVAMTPSPTWATSAPTIGTTGDDGSLICSESTCDGTAGPLADGVSSYGVAVAMVLVAVNALFA